MYSYCKICCIMLLLLVICARAAVLFEDNFQNAGYSAKNWTLISAGANELQFVDNKATIINPDETYSALAVHEFYQELSTFTVSAKVYSEFPGSGLYFCFGDMRDGYRGYAALLSDDGIYLYKFYPESVSVIGSQPSAFVKLGENRLAVSRINGKIYVFCNGYYVCGVKDEEFFSGDIALIVPPGSEASFDDVIIENCIADTSHFDPFLDDFLEKNRFGWTSLGNAKTDWLNSNLQIQTGDLQEFYNSIDLPLNSFNMKTVVHYNQGDSSSFYGFFIKAADSSDTALSFYQFAISAEKKFIIKSRNQVMGTACHQSPVEKTASDYDTLELIRDKGMFVFYANGVKLGECSEIRGNITGAGLFVSSSLDISFDKFEIMNTGMQTSNRKVSRKDVEIKYAGKKDLIVDLMGRTVSSKTNLQSNLILKIKEDMAWEKRIKIGKWKGSVITEP